MCTFASKCQLAVSIDLLNTGSLVVIQGNVSVLTSNYCSFLPPFQIYAGRVVEEPFLATVVAIH